MTHAEFHRRIGALTDGKYYYSTQIEVSTHPGPITKIEYNAYLSNLGWMATSQDPEYLIAQIADKLSGKPGTPLDAIDPLPTV